MARLQHLLPVQADEVLVQLCGAALALRGLVALQQARQVDVPVLQHHVDQALRLDDLHPQPNPLSARDLSLASVYSTMCIRPSDLMTCTTSSFHYVQ